MLPGGPQLTGEKDLGRIAGCYSDRALDGLPDTLVHAAPGRDLNVTQRSVRIRSGSRNGFNESGFLLLRDTH